MTSVKRVIIAVLMGIGCGIICIILADRGSNVLPDIVKLQILLNRTMIGFAIGISAIKMNWALHGILIGLLFGLSMAVSSAMGAEMSGFPPRLMMIASLIISAIYGFLIELVTSVIFKAKQKR